MNFSWNTKWKSVLVWACAYINFIAFILVGGYFYVKKEDDGRVGTAVKQAFIVTLIFAALSAFLSVFNSIAGLSGGYYGSGAYKFYQIAAALVAVAKIAVFAVFTVMALVHKDTEAKSEEKE